MTVGTYLDQLNGVGQFGHWGQTHSLGWGPWGHKKEKVSWTYDITTSWLVSYGPVSMTSLMWWEVPCAVHQNKPFFLYSLWSEYFIRATEKYITYVCLSERDRGGQRAGKGSMNCEGAAVWQEKGRDLQEIWGGWRYSKEGQGHGEAKMGNKVATSTDTDKSPTSICNENSQQMKRKRGFPRLDRDYLPKSYDWLHA